MATEHKISFSIGVKDIIIVILAGMLIFLNMCSGDKSVEPKLTDQRVYDSLATVAKNALAAAEKDKAAAARQEKRADSLEVHDKILSRKLKTMSKPQIVKTEGCDTAQYREAYNTLYKVAVETSNSKDSTITELNKALDSCKSAVANQDTAVTAVTTSNELHVEDAEALKAKVKQDKREKRRKIFKVVGQTVAAVLVVEAAIIAYIKLKP